MDMLEGRRMRQSQARDGTAEFSQLSFMEEMDKTSEFLSPIVCRVASLEQSWLQVLKNVVRFRRALTRIVFVVCAVCSPRFHSSPSREIRGQ